MITHFEAVFFVGNNASNRQQDSHSHQNSSYLGLRIFWMITHFEVVYFVGNNAPDTLTNNEDIFWDLNFFAMITHFVAVFFVENNASNRQQDFHSH